METCCSAWQVEFTYQVGDLLRTPEVQSLQSYSHHHRVSRYEHAMLVAQLAFRFARTFGLDGRAVARCGLLHDLYEGEKSCPGRSLLLSAPRLAPPQEGREKRPDLDLPDREGTEYY